MSDVRTMLRKMPKAALIDLAVSLGCDEAAVAWSLYMEASRREQEAWTAAGAAEEKADECCDAAQMAADAKDWDKYHELQVTCAKARLERARRYVDRDKARKATEIAHDAWSASVGRRIVDV